MKQMKLHDLVSMGIYATIYFLIVFVVTMVLRFTVPTVNTLLIPSMCALFSGLLYLTVIRKVPKFGSITILGSLMTLFFLVFSYFPLSFLPSIVFPFIADVIQHRTKIQEKLKLYLGYFIFSLGLTGPLIPMWFMKEVYVERLIAKGKSSEYIESAFSAISMTSFWICLGLILILSVIGLSIGMKNYQKHLSALSSQEKQV